MLFGLFRVKRVKESHSLPNTHTHTFDGSLLNLNFEAQKPSAKRYATLNLQHDNISSVIFPAVLPPNSQEESLCQNVLVKTVALIY